MGTMVSPRFMGCSPFGGLPLASRWSERSPPRVPPRRSLSPERCLPPSLNGLRAPHFFRLFHLAATGKLTLDGLTLAGGNIVGEGGGLRNRGRTVVMHSTLTDNAADYGGGGGKRG